MNNLVIVESPAKARTVAAFLGPGYQIEASMGHVRDLPKAQMGVDVDKNFEPKYIIPKDKQKRVNELKKAAYGAKQLWLATDPDREGEAIAWHLKELLVGGSPFTDRKKKSTNRAPLTPNQIKRVVFHEITEGAVRQAFGHPRTLNLNLVDAQQARRILDRLVGYKLSPLLWKKIKSGLSAGRVQSVAVRLVVEREREIQAFKPVEYWSITAELLPRGPAGSQPHPTSSLVTTSLRGLDGAPRSPSPLGSFTANLIELNSKRLEIHNQSEAEIHVRALEKAGYGVDKITQKEVKRYPAPPFTTSTLQQAASNRLGFTAKKTMSLAQFLYEHGLITYMRTDSLNLSTTAIQTIRGMVEKELGRLYLPTAPKFYKTKSKVAQEAHEAIRPTNIREKGEGIRDKSGITRDHVRLYDLIWKRTLASQTKEAVVEQTTVDVKAQRHSREGGNLLNKDSQLIGSPIRSGMTEYGLRATGSVIKFDGWLKLYGVSQETEEESEEGKQILPELEENQQLDLQQLLPQQHFTEAPPRYNEASLIKKLEELGIGRPSTFAPTLSTIQERFYVEKKERNFFSTTLGMAVTDFLLKYFPDIVDYSFTASMEDELDNIANGEAKWQGVIEDFYQPFEKKVAQVEGVERVKIESETVDKSCPVCGQPLVVKFGRFGKFLACSTFPECKHTEGFEEKLNIRCPKCEIGEVVTRRTKRGKLFYGCSKYPECNFASWNKPKE